VRQSAQHPHKEARKETLRSCVACRTTVEKRTLTRFVRTADGKVFCDPTGRQAGRGAYLCGEPKCFDRVRKNRLFDRALRVKLSEAEYERLRDEYTALRGKEMSGDGHSRRSDMV
jgi:predicted RNA-binding protein YlxR (DUF448 family)